MFSLFPFLCVNLLVSWSSIHFWEEWLRISVDGKSQAVGFIFFSPYLLEIAPTSRFLGFLAVFHCHLLPSLPPTTSARASLQPWNEFQELTRDSRAAVHVPGLFLWVSVRNGTGCCFCLVSLFPRSILPSVKGMNLRWPGIVALWKSQVLKRDFFSSSVFPQFSFQVFISIFYLLLIDKPKVQNLNCEW